MHDSQCVTRCFFLPVFVEGDYDADDVFCASWTVVIVTAASFVFLQFCILVVCVLCIYASRKGTPVKEEHASSSASSSGSSSSSDSSSSSPSGRSSSILPPPSSLYHRHLAGSSTMGRASSTSYRSHLHSPPAGILAHPDHSASTLRSLRTSLRD